MSRADDDAPETDAPPEVDEVDEVEAGDGEPGDGEPEPIAAIGRGKGIHARPNDLFRIAMVAILLVGLIYLQRPCADGVARFITGFDEKPPVDAGPPPEGEPEIGELRRLSDDEIRAIFNGDAGSLLDDADGGPR